MSVLIWIAVYLLIVNIIGFLMMCIDKSRSRRRSWRIPEAHLFLVALIGGAVGTTLGMFVFRHKTRHWYFLYGMPGILAVQIIIALVIIFSPVRISLF